MSTLSSAQRRRVPVRRILAGAAFVLLFSTGAFAQNEASAPITKAMASKQVGLWTVDGWKRGNVGTHCSAERPLRGAAPNGGSMQFALVQFPGGYRIVLGAEDWELKPQQSFPIELNAPPILQNSKGNAFAVGPKVVIIEMGPDAELMKKLTGLPKMEVKAAQTTFSLPMEGASEALVEVEACFAALKKPLSNPFAQQNNTPKRPPALPKGNVPAATEAPEKAPADKVTRVEPASPKLPAAKPVAAGPDPELVEEHTFLTFNGPKGTFRLEALIVRPAKTDGKLPIALITHGKNLKAEENQAVRPEWFAPQARDFAARGWLSVVVIRRGYGRSDGIPGVSRGAAYMGCENGDLVRAFDIEADDLDAALKVIAARPDADPTRVIAVGQSLGGGTVLAFAARRPAGLIGVINVSGGVWRTNGDGGVCSFDALTEAMATFGSRTRVPALWLYSENDSLFPPAVVKPMLAAYNKAGGRAKLWMFPPVVGDGHNLFADFSGRVKWLRALDSYLAANHMPNANAERVQAVMEKAKLDDSTRKVVEEYFSTPGPKLLVVSPSRKTAFWVANPTDIEGARKRVLARCSEKAGAECQVVMENSRVVERIMAQSTAEDDDE